MDVIVEDQSVMRTKMAHERTMLANERTFIAWLPDLTERRQWPCLRDYQDGKLILQSLKNHGHIINRKVLKIG